MQCCVHGCMKILAYPLYSIFISLSPVAERLNWEKDSHVQCQSYLRVNKRGRGGGGCCMNLVCVEGDDMGMR